jgi:hypothetical protein
MGLEGYSYEAYQPPLYYALLTLPYVIVSKVIDLVRGDWPDSTQALFKLYSLRFFTVVLSSLSILLSYFFFQQLLAASREIALGGIAFLALIPERAMAVSRVNNDSLTELLGVAVLLCLAKWFHQPLTPVRSLSLGLLVGLAILTKMTSLSLLPLIICVFVWQAFRFRRYSYVLAQCSISITTSALVSGWFLARNFHLYGDPTGASAFLRLVDFVPRYTAMEMVAALPRALWASRWRDTTIDAFLALLIVLAMVALAGLLTRISSDRRDRDGEQSWGLVLVMFSALIWVAPLWVATQSGIIQQIEGRFVVPSYTPAVALFLLGLFRAFVTDRALVVIVLLLIVSAGLEVAYWYHLLHVYYFGNAFDTTLFFLDKPGFVSPVFVATIVAGYLISFSSIIWTLLRSNLSVARWINKGRIAGDVSGAQSGRAH